MLIDKITSQLTKSFGEMLRLVEIKPNVFQVYLPYFHTDGDMIDIFIDVQNENQIVVKDFGQTMMRLSYDIDIDTDTRKSIFNTIIASYKVNFDNTNGIIYAMVEGVDNLLVGIMEMIAVITKVSDIAFLKEERTKNMFYKVFDAFIDDKLKGYKIIKQHSFDFDKKGDYKAPYVIYGKNRDTPIILAPILNTDRCNEYMASHWYYKSNNLTFRTIATFYNYEQISSKVFAKCNDIVDKSFSHFDSNQDEIIARIEEYVELF